MALKKGDFSNTQPVFSKGARRAFLAVGLFFLCIPFFCNHAPLMLKYQGRYYFPVLFNYTEQEMGGELLLEPDYASKRFKARMRKDDYALWPVVPYSPHSVDETLKSSPSPPDSRHWLGTDCTGKDVLVVLLYALRQDIFIALTIALLSAFLGGLIGCLQGYAGGYVDFSIQRVLEVWCSIPEMVILLLLLEVHSCTIGLFILIVALFHMVRYASVVRMAVLRIRTLDHVLAARVMGLSSWHIFRHHVLPGITGLVYAKIPFQASAALGVLSALTILRGPITDQPSLGSLIYQGKTYLCAPWIILPSVTCLMCFVMCAVFWSSRVQSTSLLREDSYG